jgi:fructoselysine-6-P-deglycase FrlB-like protein
MTEMIAAEPALARRILSRLADPGGPAARLAEAIRSAAVAGAPISVVGCGTSEHGALGAVEILRDAMGQAGLPAWAGSPVSMQAFEAALEPAPGGLCIGVSHEGGTWATNRALEAARAAGATVALITVSDRSPGAALADIVVTTEEMDQSWCHTIGYLSPLLAATAVGAHLAASSVDPEVVSALLAEGARDEAGAEGLAAAIAGADRLIVVASGADRPAGRELVLKVEEASWLPSAFRDLETFLHGHLPAMDGRTALLLILADRARRAERIERAAEALAASRVVGIRAGAILTEGVAAELDVSLTRAGRLLVRDAPALPMPVAALLGTATPLQLLAERLARARGTNPDPIRRDDPRYGEAAAQAR